jgi:hypothetical protein
VTEAANNGANLIGIAFENAQGRIEAPTRIDGGTEAPVNITPVLGAVMIQRVSIRYGDVNGDGEIDALDITLLRRFVAGWNVGEINLAAADTNGDGRVDEADITVLRRYVAGWPNMRLGPR